MININENIIDKLITVDGDFSKLYLYMIKNNINSITDENKKDISQKLFIPYNKMDYIINFYKFNNILPKSFVNKIKFENNKEINKNDNVLNSEDIIYLNNYTKEKFNLNNDLDYTLFYKNSLKKYNFSIDAYKYIIDFCSEKNDRKNITYIETLLSDFKENGLKTENDIKNYIKIKIPNIGQINNSKRELDRNENYDEILNKAINSGNFK